MTPRERLKYYRVSHEATPKQIAELKADLRTKSNELGDALRKAVKASPFSIKSLAEHTGLTWVKLNNLLHGNIWFIDPDDAEKILQTIEPQ